MVMISTASAQHTLLCTAQSPCLTWINMMESHTWFWMRSLMISFLGSFSLAAT